MIPQDHRSCHTYLVSLTNLPCREDTLSLVKQTLEGRGASIGTIGPDKPSLFCNSKWWKLVDFNAPALDANGDPTIKMANGDTRTVRSFLANRLRGKIDGKAKVVYRTDGRYHAYTIGTRQAGEFFCDQANNLAITDDSDDVDPSAIIMCPQSFQLQPGQWPARTDSLGSKKPIKDQSLDELQSRSVTFLHEMVHLVLGNEETRDKGKEYCKFQISPLAFSHAHHHVFVVFLLSLTA